MKILYTAQATTRGGRDGHGESSDGRVKVDFSLPQELGGAGGPGATPEHLFATGYSACFGSALQRVADRRHLRPDPIEVTARVAIGQTDDGRFGFEIVLTAKLGGVDRATAEALLREAHEVCPYSNAVEGNVPVNVLLA